MTFLGAGFDTTASTLSFCFYVLINNPSEMGKIQDELDSVDVVIKLNGILIKNYCVINFMKFILKG